MLERQAYLAALQWHIDAGADEALAETPVDATAMPDFRKQLTADEAPKAANPPPHMPAPAAMPLGASDAQKESLRLAREAHTLEELRAAVAAFDGLGLKKTATSLVFSDGNPQAPIMLVGEAPGGDEDRIGKPFVGVSGQLLDKILACIGLDRANEDPAHSVYISNILNWRPPGNRTPSPAEIEVSLPFIEKHIALIQPKLLIFAGGVSTKALLGSESNISKLRGRFHDYTPLTERLFDSAPAPIPALATYHPSYLLRTPGQKKLVWQDMLMLQQKRRELGLTGN